MTSVKGKWALLTGASRGLGYHAALFMAKQGCNLILHSRDKSHTEKVLAEVKDFGVDAYAVSADLLDISSVNAMLKEIDSKGTQVDIVLNNAAVQIAYRVDYFKTPPEDFSDSFVINTIAPAMICYHFLPKMIERGFGRIVNTTSGIRLEPEQAGYSASKAALDKFTVDIGSKLQGTDVMINLADPGWCRTDLGGPNAPNAPESVIPGIVIGVFVSDKKNGRHFGAQDFAGMTLEDAVIKAEKINSPYA
jgi:short-subunit dehydrogenase